jgi:ubiquitin conjugation factor E4 B
LSGLATPTPNPEQSAEGTSAAPASLKPASPQDAESASKPKINITHASTPPATLSENPFTKLAGRPSNGTGASPVRNTSVPGTLKRPRAELDVQSTTPQPARKTAIPTSDEPIDVYENKVLGQIFRITLDPEQKVNASNHKLIYLPNLRQELEDENVPVRLSKDRLDSAILEAASSIPHSKSILDYLLPSWKRITKALKSLRGYANAKDAILKEAKRLCMSHCIFAVEMPELYGLVRFGGCKTHG